MLSWIVTFLIFALIIGVVVMIHEFGHFIAARISDMEVEEFSFGFGPKLFSKKGKETEYMIKLLPVGGYVKILGEEEEVKDERSFSQKPLKNRIFVVVAGVLMNFILAVFLFYIVLGIKGFEYEGLPYYKDFNVWFGSQEEKIIYPVTVLDIIEDGGAEKAAEEYDLEVPFMINEINDEPIESVEELKNILGENKEEKVDIEIESEDGETKTIQVAVDEKGLIGVELTATVKIWVISYSGAEKVFSGFFHFANMTKANFFVLGKLFSQAVEERDVAPVSNAVSGPLGLLVIVDVVKEFGGVIGLIDLVATLNLVLVIMNLLPLPALDGGQTLLMVIEGVRGKPLNKNIERWIVNVSMILLFALMIVVSVKDFFQFGFWSTIKEFFVTTILKIVIDKLSFLVNN
jgi:regulator of sigma E protease